MMCYFKPRRCLHRQADSEVVRKSYDNAITMAGKARVFYGKLSERGVYFLEQDAVTREHRRILTVLAISSEWGALAKGRWI
jgi:hypothetical protein